MAPRTVRVPPQTDPPESPPPTSGARSTSLTLRNHDGERSYELTVRARDERDELVIDHSVALAPLECVSVARQIDRGIYRVHAAIAGDSDRAECLIGPGLGETALVELGNGLVSVAERGV